MGRMLENAIQAAAGDLLKCVVTLEAPTAIVNDELSSSALLTG